MKMKKGQAQQIFVWIFILILAVTTLFFGIRTFRQGENLKDEVLLVDFFKNLERQVNNFYYLDIGSSGKEDFILPNGVREVCFINLDKYNGADDYIKSLRDFSNVFVFPKEEFNQNRFRINNSFVDDNSGDGINNIDWDGSVCPKVIGGRMEIKLINQGRDGVQINEA